MKSGTTIKNRLKSSELIKNSQGDCVVSGRETARIVIEATKQQYRSLAELAFRGKFPPTKRMIKEFPDLVREFGIHKEFEYPSLGAYTRALYRIDFKSELPYQDFGEDSQVGNPDWRT